MNFGEEHKKVKFLSPHIHIIQLNSTHLMGDVHFDPLVKEVSARFLHCNITIFPFYIPFVKSFMESVI